MPTNRGGPGTNLGPYEIVSQIGAGGMGEVWRARDTRLERDVAIKILHRDIAEGITFHEGRVLALKYAGDSSTEPLRLIRNWRAVLE